MSEPTPTPSDPSPAEPVIDPANPPADPPPNDPPSDPPADPSGDPVETWGENWRQDYAGDDEKMAKRLERYASPKAAIDALVAAQNKISSGELKPALGEDATDEEKSQWRLDNGIPDKPDEYEITLSDGLVVGDADKPIVDDFLEYAHAANYTPEQVNQGLQWYYDFQDKAAQMQTEADDALKQTNDDAMHAEWGGDYRKNLNLAMNLLDQAPDGFKDRLLDARLADGVPLGNDPAALNWLVNLSREINPVATVVPGSGANAMQAIESEISSLKKMMGDRSSDYWKGADAAKNQARYLELTEARQKHG